MVASMHLKVFQCGNLEVEKALFKPFLKIE